uniref:C2H2-type domain-containing protein n=1 Tax=Heterorhabditis bacteriophora TaxID=37862 RepID=A0A1I7XSG6_HETBA
MFFVIVCVPDGDLLKDLAHSLDSLSLSYNICQNMSTSTIDTRMACKESVISCNLSQNCVSKTIEIPPVITDGPININNDVIQQEVKHGEEQWINQNSPSDGSFASPIFVPCNTIPKTRAPRNIKRYRRQTCRICGASTIVPFLRSKMLHAAVHSDFKRLNMVRHEKRNIANISVFRYKCNLCDKRAVSMTTIKLHIKAHHTSQKETAFTDEMTEEENIKLLALTERCYTNPYL